MARTGTPFGGLAGEMLSRTVSVGAIFTGVVFLIAGAALGALAEKTGSDLILLGGQVLVSFLLAHFAVEGYSDKWERAGRAIPPAETGVVALRYLVLSIILLVPLAIVAGSREAALGVMATPGPVTILFLIYVLIVAASPPALLVVAVSASSWRDLLSTGHWGSRFRGRWSDFFLIYVVFVGALFCVVLICLPIIAVAAAKGANTMAVTGGAIFVFAIGFAISLLGRLCGSFAVPPQPAVAEEKPPALHPALSQFDRAGAVRPGAAGVPSAPAPPPRKTVLLDAGQRVEQLRAAHGSDSAALAAALGELDEAFLPHPAVRQALALALLAAGRHQEAVDVAREAIPLCLKSGNVSAAALIYEALLASGETFGLTKEQIVALGDALRSMKHSAGAVEVYAGVLRSNAGDVKAMKGMIAVAQDLSQQKETAAEAVRIYDDLGRLCPGSPLLDFVNAERAKAQRKAEG